MQIYSVFVIKNYFGTIFSTSMFRTSTSYFGCRSAYHSVSGWLVFLWTERRPIVAFFPFSAHKSTTFFRHVRIRTHLFYFNIFKSLVIDYTSTNCKIQFFLFSKYVRNRTPSVRFRTLGVRFRTYFGVFENVKMCFLFEFQQIASLARFLKLYL